MEIVIAAERPDSADVIALVGELEAVLDPLYPPASRHGYDVQKLLEEEVAFFVIRCDGVAAGCGGVQLIDDYAELKRMYVRPRWRRLGLAQQLLEHLARVADRGGANTLRLETGIYQTEAIGLYERFGFQHCGPFGDYSDDPLSLFFQYRLPG